MSSRQKKGCKTLKLVEEGGSCPKAAEEGEVVEEERRATTALKS